MPQFAGRVVKRRVARGSKSEREAVCLDTGGKRYILRRKDGNPFHDEELEKLVGKQISADGSVIGGGVFLISEWSDVSAE